MVSVHKIYARLRSVGARGNTIIALVPDNSSWITLGNGEGFPAGFSFSSPLPNAQLGIVRLSLARTEIQLLPSTPITLLDLNFYVASEMPSIRGAALMPAGADLQISTAWDRVDLIGFSSWVVAVAGRDDQIRCGPNDRA